MSVQMLSEAQDLLHIQLTAGLYLARANVLFIIGIDITYIL